MKIQIDGLTVYFPYEHIYPEQYEYMKSLLQAIRSRQNGHCLLEMPCGTGKTIALLSLIVSFQLNDRNAGKLIYCTRTVTEMEQVFSEMTLLDKYLKKEFSDHNILCVGLSSRKNMCCLKEVCDIGYVGEKIDAACRSRTARWVVEASEDDASDIENCHYYLKLDKSSKSERILKGGGVYSLDNLKKYGMENGLCPYFLARRAIEYANVVVFNYQYILDPKISAVISKSFQKDAIVVFDEAHNIDSICIQSLSVNIDKRILKQAVSNIKTLKESVESESKRIQERLQAEYTRLVAGLDTEGVGYSEAITSNPVLPEDILKQAVPGTIRKGINFLNFMRRLIMFVNSELKTDDVVTTFPAPFLEKMKEQFFIDKKTLKFCATRLISLLNTLQITALNSYKSLKILCDFSSLLGTYQKGFKIIIEPYDRRNPTVRDPVLQFCCLDSRICMKHVFKKFKNVVITSGTLSPLDIYPKLLGFTPSISKSFNITLVRKCVCPIIISKGNDQEILTTRFKDRGNKAIARNYGNLLLELAQTIPDGIVCFFTSYQYLEDVFLTWNNMSICQNLLKHKLLYIETTDTQMSSLALLNFRKAVDCGRGAIFLCVARGKVSEGVDFEGHYGRCVVLFGVPFLNTQSRVLQARMDFNHKNLGIRNDRFLNFDAIRNSAQCISRVLRNKTDYGVMILADHRFNRTSRRKMLPVWIRKFLVDEHTNLSVETAMAIVRRFMLAMAQGWNEKEVLGKCLLSVEDLSEKGSVRIGKRKQNEMHYVDNQENDNDDDEGEGLKRRKKKVKLLLVKK